MVLLTNGYVANFNNGSAGNGKPVTVSGLSLGGSASGNYSLTQPAGLSANITALGVTVSSGLSANNKAYDGTATATMTSNNVVLAGVLAGDAGNVVLLTNGYVANFTNGSAGNGKPVTVSGLSLGGSAAGNYMLTQPTGLSANITALGVTVSSGITANNKAYDGTTMATITSNNVVLAGVLAGDAGNVVLVTNGYVANFTNGSAGNGKPVTVSGLSLGGSASGNYSLTQPAGLSANITALGVTVSSGLSANNKAYDGTASATLTSNNVVLAGVLAGDAGNVVLLTNGYVANFNNGSAGNGKPVTVSGLSLGGSASGNYSLTQPTGLSANITALGVTVSSGITANNKAYDGTATCDDDEQQRGAGGGAGRGRGQRGAVDQRLRGEFQQWERREREAGDGERSEPGRERVGELQVDATGGIEREHHGLGGDGEQRVEREQQGV